MGWISDVGTKAFTAGVAQISSAGFVHHVELDADWTLLTDVLHQLWEFLNWILVDTQVNGKKKKTVDYTQQVYKKINIFGVITLRTPLKPYATTDNPTVMFKVFLQ